MENIPFDVIFNNIVPFLGVLDFIYLSSTCKHLYQLQDNQKIWEWYFYQEILCSRDADPPISKTSTSDWKRIVLNALNLKQKWINGNLVGRKLSTVTALSFYRQMTYIATCTKTPVVHESNNTSIIAISSKIYMPGTYGGFEDELGTHFLNFHRSFTRSEALKVEKPNTLPTRIHYFNNSTAIFCDETVLKIWKLTQNDLKNASEIASIDSPPSYTFEVSANGHPTLLCASLQWKKAWQVNYLTGTTKNIQFPSTYEKLSLCAYNHPIAFLSSQNEVIAFNIETNAEVYHFSTQDYSSVFVQGGDRLVTICGKKCKIRNVEDGTEISSFSIAEQSLPFSFNKNYLVFAKPTSVLIYDKTGKLKATYSTVVHQPTALNSVESVSCNETKLALTLFRDSPIIFHFDEFDSPPVNIVELKPDGSTLIHKFSLYELYDGVGDLMDGKMKNLFQFVHTPIGKKSELYRIYMLGVVEDSKASLSSKLMKLLTGTEAPNPKATIFMNKSNSNLDYPHSNILWPVFKRHVVPLVDAAKNYGAKYEVRGSAFYFKETRESQEKDWILADLTAEEVLSIK